MISGFTNYSFLGNDDRLFIYEVEAASWRCHVIAWYYECFDFRQVGVLVPLATLLSEKRRIHSSTAWKPPGCKAWSRAFRARRWPASSKSFPFTLHQSRCLCRRGRMVRQCSTPTFGSLEPSLCFSICRRGVVSRLLHFWTFCHHHMYRISPKL